MGLVNKDVDKRFGRVNGLIKRKKEKSKLPCKQKFGDYHWKGKYFGVCCDAAVDVEISPFN